MRDSYKIKDRRRIEIPQEGLQRFNGVLYIFSRIAIEHGSRELLMSSTYELLMSLKLTSTLEEFRAEFELFAGPLRSAEPEYLKGIFLNGLKDAIKAELKLHPVDSLSEMMDFALRIDDPNKMFSKPAESSHKPQNSFKSFPSNNIIS